MDFAEFLVEFADQPGVRRRVWQFALVLGHSRWLWGRFCPSQKLDTMLRCHVLAFEACGGATAEVLYVRMKTAVLGERDDGTVLYHLALVALLRHYGSTPRACRAYRAKTKGKVERPFRYIRQDFFLGRTFRNLDDLNARFATWRAELANARVHGTTNRVVQEAFAAERAHLRPLPLQAYDAVLTVERRVSHEGMVSVGDAQDGSGGDIRRDRAGPADVELQSGRPLHDAVQGFSHHEGDPENGPGGTQGRPDSPPVARGGGVR